MSKKVTLSAEDDATERLALDLMNTDPHGPYRGCVRPGLRIDDIHPGVREIIVGPYIKQARALMVGSR